MTNAAWCKKGTIEECAVCTWKALDDTTWIKGSKLVEPTVTNKVRAESAFICILTDIQTERKKLIKASQFPTKTKTRQGHRRSNQKRTKQDKTRSRQSKIMAGREAKPQNYNLKIRMALPKYIISLPLTPCKIR
jgi:hypothetical protein